jgi:hypothetical protein
MQYRCWSFCPSTAGLTSLNTGECECQHTSNKQQAEEERHDGGNHHLIPRASPAFRSADKASVRASHRTIPRYLGKEHCATSSQISKSPVRLRVCGFPQPPPCRTTGGHVHEPTSFR